MFYGLYPTDLQDHYPLTEIPIHPGYIHKF